MRTQTTTTPVPTTKKSSFFGGIRNLFRSKDSTTSSTLDETPATTPTTPATPKSPKPTAASIASGLATAKQTVIVPVVPVNPNPATTKSPTSQPTPSVAPVTPTPTPAKPRQPLHDFESFATITLSTKPPKVKEDFPALPSRPNQREDFPALPTPRQPSAGGVLPLTTAAPSISTAANAWSSLPTQKPSNSNGPTPTPSRVNFIPNVHSTTQKSLTPTTVSPGETTNAELETVTEALFTKENSLISTVTINYQAKTQSSATVDLAPLPYVLSEKSINNALIAFLYFQPFDHR